MITPSIPLLYFQAEARSPRVPDPGPSPVRRRDVVRRAPGVRGVGRVAARERGRRQRRLGPRGEPRRRAIDVSPRAAAETRRFGAATSFGSLERLVRGDGRVAAPRAWRHERGRAAPRAEPRRRATSRRGPVTAEASASGPPRRRRAPPRSRRPWPDADDGVDAHVTSPHTSSAAWISPRARRAGP